MSQAVNMFPEETNTGSKALPIFIAVLAFLLIIGGASWFYFNTRSVTPEPVVTTPTEKPAAETTTEPSITLAPTELSDAISQLDKELTVIGQDEQSDDDTINL